MIRIHVNDQIDLVSFPGYGWFFQDNAGNESVSYLSMPIAMTAWRRNAVQWEAGQ